MCHSAYKKKKLPYFTWTTLILRKTQLLVKEPHMFWILFQRNTGSSRPDKEMLNVSTNMETKNLSSNSFNILVYCKAPSKISFSRTDGCRNFDESEIKEGRSIPTQTWLFIKVMEYLFSEEGKYALADIAASENFQNAKSIKMIANFKRKITRTWSM